jgi:hypothetical protein
MTAYLVWLDGRIKVPQQNNYVIGSTCTQIIMLGMVLYNKIIENGEKKL